jgi:hypothetical protein
MHIAKRNYKLVAIFERCETFVLPVNTALCLGTRDFGRHLSGNVLPAEPHARQQRDRQDDAFTIDVQPLRLL